MTRDPAQARDSMASLFAAAWASSDAWASLGLPDAPRIAWQGRRLDPEPSLDAPYCRWIARHGEPPRPSLAGDQATRIYPNSGMIIVQCLAPLDPGNGFEVAERMAIIARDAYRGKQTSDCIWFRNARIEEVGEDAGWFLFNAYVDFTYDEVS